MTSRRQKKESRKNESPLIVVRRALLAYWLALKEGIATPKRKPDGTAVFSVREEMRRATELLEELS
jgi:hypothetical protein